MTIQAIRDEIVVDVGADSSDSTLLTNIFSWIKQSLRRLPLYTRDRLLLTTVSASLAAGEYQLTLPTDFISERQVWIVRGGQRIELNRQSFDTFRESYSSNASGDPSTYNVSGNTMSFNRKANVQKTIYLEHFKEQDDVELADTFFGGSDLAEIIKDTAKYYYYMYEEDNTTAMQYLTMADAGLRKLDERYVNKEIPEYVEER